MFNFSNYFINSIKSSNSTICMLLTPILYITRSIFHSWIISNVIFPKCVFYFFKLLGLATMSLSFQSVNNVNKVQHTVFIRSKLGILYDLVLIFTLIGTNYYLKNLTLLLTSDHAVMIKFDRAIDLSRIVLTVTISVYILTFFCVYQKKSLQIAKRIKVE